MSQGSESRVWTIVSSDISQRVTVTESLNCDAVTADNGLDKAETSETKQRVGDELRTEVSYVVPGYECKVGISWNSPLDDLTRRQGQVRRHVLSIIWLGVREKEPMMNLVER